VQLEIIMFVIILTYKKDLVEVEQHLEAHRAFLDEGYRLRYFLASGPCNPRTGGVIIAAMASRVQLQSYLVTDPFMIYDIADYQLIEFTPTKYRDELVHCINQKD
jgi:uncharacterized protein YciI